MKNNRLKIIALSLMGTLIISATGCSSKKNIDSKYNSETKQYELVGEIDNNSLNNYYVIELYNNDEIYLTECKYSNENIEYIDIYTKKCIYKENENRGKVKNIIPFNVFVRNYAGNQDSYDADEIENIFELTQKEYAEYKGEEKKLLLTK